MTDNGLAALAEALHRYRGTCELWTMSEASCPFDHAKDAAAILAERDVFLPDGLTGEDLRRSDFFDEQAAALAALRAALEDMVRQFAYWSNSAGGIYTGGLSALEEAFDVLGWDDPYPLPDRRCDEPGCMEDGTMGWPTRPGGTGLNGGYRTTCWGHSDIGKARAILAIINPEETL